MRDERGEKEREKSMQSNLKKVTSAASGRAGNIENVAFLCLSD